MKEKLRREIKKELKDKNHQPLAVQLAPAHSTQPPAEMAGASHSSAMASLDDPIKLGYVRDMYEYLDSARLMHCRNCDEEFVVFDNLWPQHGVEYAGPIAGKCETIARAGFVTSWKDPNLCSRCAGNTVYATMFSEANGQRLGPRRAALSQLTWYEALLVARVHPVISVITLTATGLLCFAGHVTNYYVNVLEWFQGLPAVLRDKKWFLIKRRRAIGKADASARQQKKPTTANRVRLQAAIEEALTYMPHVYKGSVVLTAEMEKYPLDGEKEIMEEEFSPDLESDVKIDRESFSIWMDARRAESGRNSF